MYRWDIIGRGYNGKYETPKRSIAVGNFDKFLSFSILRHAATGKFSGEQKKTIECLCLWTIGLIAAPWKFDVLKTSIFALEALLLGQLFVLRTSNFHGATMSR